MIYLKPGEVYAVLKLLITSTLHAFSIPEEKNLIRWHFTFEK
jgi:hypothetical protein